MIGFIAHAFSLIALVIGSFTDLKTREVPDFISYSLIFGGFGLNALFSAVFWDYSYFLGSIAGFIVFFAISMILFYSGQFGGADAKLLMGLGAVVGVSVYPFKLFQLNQFLVSFSVNLLFVGAVYGLLWAVFLVIKHRKKFLSEFKKLFKLKIVRFIRIFILSVSMLFIIISFFLPKKIQIFVLLLAFLLILTFYLWISAKVIEKSCMQKFVPVEKLTEGDWIVDDIKLDNKQICGPKDLGISQEQINILLKNKDKIPKILIKEGIPFVPSFLLAYVVTLIFGNLVLLFI